MADRPEEPSKEKTTRWRSLLLGWGLAMAPAALVVWLVLLLDRVRTGGATTMAIAWAPSLGVELAFYFDGLSLLFALLIAGIGVLISVYSGGYMAGEQQVGRFFLYLYLFMASMLGLVLAGNLLTLFVFWELTSLTSFFLIGFESDREEARASALQALLVTSLGGLSLLVGLLLLGQIAGTMELSALLRNPETLSTHPLAPAAFVLILVGAATKSAQFPFHFWLPNAMEAPSPVSAYLHSSTMVKAGVYLLARLSPVFAGTPLWRATLIPMGLITMLLGAALALGERDLKRVLAHSTVSVLGLLVLLLGMGSVAAVEAAMLFLLAHALYKATLFLVAGSVSHATHERRLDRLGGLLRWMPLTAIAGVLAAASMAGIPPMLGMIGKEAVYGAAWMEPGLQLLLTTAAIVAGAMLVAVAILVWQTPFIARAPDTPQHAHEGAFSLWGPPLLLGLLGLACGVLPHVLAEPLVGPAASAVLQQPVTLHLALWHGIGPTLFMEAGTLAGGIVLFAVMRKRRRLYRAEALPDWGPARWYDGAIQGLIFVAQWQTQVLQSGLLRIYLLITLLATTGLVLWPLAEQWHLVSLHGWSDVRFYEAGVVVLILCGAAATVRSTSRLGAVAALGVVGYGVATIFVFFGAPDLAMTQFVIETLLVVLFVLVFYHLPPFRILTSRATRLRDAVVALGAGLVMAALVLIATSIPAIPDVSDYYRENGLPAAHGRNIVNVILVDFRAGDTLGEITVLAIAGAGVYALLRFARQESTG
ncbi:MAG: DUF4040 domain-containing protein [Rhodopirellula sp.]|nr:DUF4040 domain-containing protein [Rhodopirellula sp.]